MYRKPLERLLDRYVLDNDKHQIHLVRGDPGILLPKMVEEKQIDLIVMGTVVRTGIPGLFIGCTAESVLRQVNCALLTVKPGGVRDADRIRGVTDRSVWPRFVCNSLFPIDIS